MRATATRWYQASEFAKLTGVTVRTLHHYDRLGLLEPSGRTVAGYRLYGERDFARLQQIVTLKFIGFPLKQIKDLLEHDSSDLLTALRFQRKIIEARRHQLDLAAKAIEEAEDILASHDEPDWEAFAKIIEVISMQNDWEWAKNYYTEQQLEELAKRWSPELQAQAERDWATLMQDVEAAIRDGEDPASDRAQVLAERWSQLLEAFTGSDPGIAANLRQLYADQANWPSTARKPFSDEVGAFIAKAAGMRR